MRPAYFVIRGQVMAQFVIRGQDMLQLWCDADRGGAENKALAVANLCFNWPNYAETDKTDVSLGIIWPPWPNYAEDLEIVLHFSPLIWK